MIKKVLLRIPVVGYSLRLGSSLIMLPKRLRNIEHGLHHQSAKYVATQDKININNLRLIELIQEIDNRQKSLSEYADVIATLKNKLFLVDSNTSKSTPKDSTSNRVETFADNHKLDDFYIKFENKFRGDEKSIIKRLAVYLPYFEARGKKLENLPILDLGCGRGEFLELLNDNRVLIRGLDINKKMVQHSQDKGHDVVEGDALSYLSKQKGGSFAGITGFHIVEHIPFPELMQIFSECFRTIDKNGIIIFETPNPENITVGALNFNYDPSHLKPLPPQLLAFCLEYVGFSDIEILPLHPEREVANDDALINEALVRLFGPRDYAVIAKKT